MTLIDMLVLSMYGTRKKVKEIMQDIVNFTKQNDKMMDYEKLYKEALKRAKGTILYYKEHNRGDEAAIEDLEEIFPELKESEDEKIRKEILEYFQQFENEELRGVNISYWIAWLEKQGEQKPINDTDEGIVKAVADTSILDMDEPKFKVGNWYQCTKDFFGKGVTFDKNTAYYCAREGCLQCEYGCHIAIVKDLYDNFKLWTIQDAKDGDVLVDGNFIGIFKENNYNPSDKSGCMFLYCSFDMNNDKFYTESGGYNPNYFYPATKEQSDLLFQKMKEAGYEWDAEKKELKKIEQKPTWSEADERNLKSIMKIIKEKAFADYDVDENNNMLGIYGILESWLKSLKQKLKGE